MHFVGSSVFLFFFFFNECICRHSIIQFKTFFWLLLIMFHSCVSHCLEALGLLPSASPLVTSFSPSSITFLKIILNPFCLTSSLILSNSRMQTVGLL